MKNDPAHLPPSAARAAFIAASQVAKDAELQLIAAIALAGSDRHGLFLKAARHYANAHHAMTRLERKLDPDGSSR